jgi:hypothetical protein
MWDETAEDIEVIWVRGEQKYFCKWGWTGEPPNSPSGKSHRLADKSSLTPLKNEPCVLFVLCCGDSAPGLARLSAVSAAKLVSRSWGAAWPASRIFDLKKESTPATYAGALAAGEA